MNNVKAKDLIPKPSYIINGSSASEKVSFYSLPNETLVISQRWSFRIDNSVASIHCSYDNFSIYYKNKE